MQTSFIPLRIESINRDCIQRYTSTPFGQFFLAFETFSPSCLGTDNLQQNFQEKITHGWANEAAGWEAGRAISRCPILRWGAQSRDWLQLHGQQLTLLV